jgi:hypothetical protein
MAGNSVIGALRVDLGLNSAQFTAGLKKAESGLASFGRTAAASLQVVAVAAIAAGTAMGFAVKHAIDHADALSKSAQKAGVTVEALSRLEFAAKLSDISLEGLTGGLQKLSKAMADATITKTSTAATAFKALGINITDASGKLRSSTAVLGEIADRFSRLEDGSTKTALAMQIFGKSGAELIPLLNGGSKGLADMAAEADRLGITISTKTAQAAERFNDTLTRIGAIMGGVVNQVMEASLPALQAFADALTDPRLAQAIADLSVTLINAFKDFLPYLQNAARNITYLRDLMVDFNEKSRQGQQNAVVDLQNQVTTIENRIVENKQRLAAGGAGTLFGLNDAALQAQIDQDIATVQPLIDKIAELQRTMAGPKIGGAFAGGWGAGGLTPPSSGGNTPVFTPPTKALKNWNDEVDGTIKLQQELAASIRDDVTSAITGFVDAIASGTDPLKAMADELGNIGKMLLDAGIQSLFRNIFTSARRGQAF